MAQRCFLVVTHIFDKYGQGTEKVEIVRNLKDSHLTQANIIIDVLKHEYVKNRLANEEGVTQETMTNSMIYYIEQHKQQIIDLLKKYA